MRTRYHGCLCFSKEKPQHARASFVASLSLPLEAPACTLQSQQSIAMVQHAVLLLMPFS